MKIGNQHFPFFAPKFQKFKRKVEVMTRREKRRHSFFFYAEKPGVKHRGEAENLENRAIGADFL